MASDPLEISEQCPAASLWLKFYLFPGFLSALLSFLELFRTPHGRGWGSLVDRAFMDYNPGLNVCQYYSIELYCKAVL